MVKDQELRTKGDRVSIKIKSYKDLRVWQVSVELVEEIYRLADKFPKSETFGLIHQMQRAAVSIPSNIAEGHARDSTKEFLHYLSITLGSLAELETQLTIAEKLNYLNSETSKEILTKADELGKMIRNLQKALKGKIRE